MALRPASERGNVDPDGVLEFVIQRGSIGWTRVESFDLTGAEPVLVATTTWGGIARTDGFNPYAFSLQASSLIGATVVSEFADR